MEARNLREPSPRAFLPFSSLVAIVVCLSSWKILERQISDISAYGSSLVEVQPDGAAY